MTEIVTIRCDTFTVNIYLPLLPTWTLGRAKKLFRLLERGLDLDRFQENVKAKEAIWETLNTQADDALKEWECASHIFRREWEDCAFLERQGLPVRDAKRKNAQLMTEVKRAKRNYERMEKLKKCFQEIVNHKRKDD